MNNSFFVATVFVLTASFSGYCDKYRELCDSVVRYQTEHKLYFESKRQNLKLLWEFVDFKDFPDCSGVTARSSGDSLKGLYKPIGRSVGGYRANGIEIINKDTYETDGSIFVYVGIVSWLQRDNIDSPIKNYRLWKYEYVIIHKHWRLFPNFDYCVVCDADKRNVSGDSSARSDYYGENNKKGCSCAGRNGDIISWFFNY
jgi:hypothetical protein